MKTLIIYQRQLLSVLIPFAMLIGLVFLMKSSAFLVNSDTLSVAVTIDLLLIVPVVYFLLIRKTTIPKTTVVLVMILGLVIGTYFLPENNQAYLELFKFWVLPLIEVSILTYIVFKVRQAIKKIKSVKNTSPDVFTTLKETCYEIFPKKVAIPFATEIAVFYYGFINWSKLTLDKNEYSYHKNSSAQAFLGAIIMIIGIETFVFHVLLVKWQEVVAWVVTGLSIYTALQVFGFAKSISKRPLIIEKDTLLLRYGLLSETIIELKNITKIEMSAKSIEDDKTIKTLSPLAALEGHNFILYLNKENVLEGLYGFRKTYSKIAFSVDEKERFKTEIEKALQESV